MIGQKGFFNTSNSNTDANLGDAIVSSGNATPPNPNFTPETVNQPRPKKPLSPVLLVLISVFATAAVGALVYFLFLAPKNTDGETREIIYASPDNDGTKTNEETIAEFDKQIAAASDDDVELGLTLNKVGYYMLMEDYESALSVLSGIDVSSLNDFDQYRVYNHFASVYNGLNNKSKAEEYRKLAEAANSRDFSNAESANE